MKERWTEKQIHMRDRQKDKQTGSASSFTKSGDSNATALCPPYCDGRMKNK